MSGKIEGDDRGPTMLHVHAEERRGSGLSYKMPSPLRKSGILQPLVIAILVAALISGMVVVIRLASPGQAWAWLPVAVFLISLEAVFTGRWLDHPGQRQLNRSAYRLAEIIVLALGLRLLTWTVSGGIPGWQVWRSYLLSPLTFLDGLYFGYLLCGFLAWERANVFSTLLRGLAVSRAEERFYGMSPDEQKTRAPDRPLARQRPQIFRALVSSWLGGGFLLALAAAISTVDITSVNLEAGLRSVTRLGMHPTMLMALLTYFLLGLWLISEARLEMLRARWLVDGVSTIGDMVANWRRTSLVLIALVSIVAAFLPIGSTFGAALLLNTLFSAVLLVAQVLFLLMTSLFVALLSFMGFGVPPEEAQAQPAVVQPAPPPIAEAPLGETAAFVFGSVFWILVAAVAIVALAYFLRDRGLTLRFALLNRLLRGLSRWITMLRAGATARTTSVRDAVRGQLRRLLPTNSGRRSPWRFLRVNSLPPREQIRYFYLSTVRRAADEGVSRQASETPSEFARHLQAQWPEASEEIDALTSSFQEARYSARIFQPAEVGPVKKVWKRVRGAIRRSFRP